jgi:acetyl-CoA carboxylase carboxyltransferase component
MFDKLVAEHMDRGRAINMASHLEIDDVIDPAETRAWLARGLRAAAGTPLPPRRGLLDTW